MTHVETQTDDILIDGVPLNEFIKNYMSENDSSVWKFMQNEDDNEDDDEGDNEHDNEHDNEDESKNIDKGSSSAGLLSEKDIQEMRESILYCIDENVINNPLSFSDPDYHVKLEDSIYDIIHYTFSDTSFIGADIFKFTE